jgi:hypothetical protein
MVGNAQLRDRPPHDQTGGIRILGRRVANFHYCIMLPGRICDNLERRARHSAEFLISALSYFERRVSFAMPMSTARATWEKIDA